MRKKFLKAILLRSTDKLMKEDNSIAKVFWQISADLLNEPDAIDDHSQAHGEGKLQKILTAYCGECDNIERYQQLEVVDGVLSCNKCKADIILDANNIIYHKAKTGRFTTYDEQHSKGFISIENLVRVVENLKIDADLGIQIAVDGRVWICIDGRVWICIDGISFLRFKPKGE